MEENEKTNRGKLINPIPISMEISNSSHADPLFSSILTLYILILLYFPDHNTFSPLLLITLTLLLILLRFGATQKKERNCTNILTDEAAAADRHQTPTATVSTFCSSYPDQDHKWVTCKASNFPPGPCFEDSFVEWNVRAPLEVIYEGEEGKEAGEEENAKDHQGTAKDPYCIDRYSSLSLFYPETDSDSSSDGGDFLAFGAWGSPESACYRWEDDDREALIEIALDTNSSNNFNSNQGKETDSENFDGEEENNLIEIDISPTRDEERW